MSVAFSYYVTIRNNYCLAYHGQCAEYVTVLRLLRPAIQSQLSDVAVFISCADKLAYLLAGEDNVIPFSSLRDRKNDIAHIRQIGADLSGQHPLVTLMTESGLKFPALPSARPPASRRCLICPDSGHPDRCLDDLVRPLSLARMEGFSPVVVGSDLNAAYPKPDVRPEGAAKFDWLDTAGWVIGVDNEYVYEAAARGIRTTFLDRGGAELYRKLAPGGQVLSL
jgi:hypothetical protein